MKRETKCSRLKEANSFEFAASDDLFDGESRCARTVWQEQRFATVDQRF